MSMGRRLRPGFSLCVRAGRGMAMRCLPIRRRIGEASDRVDKFGRAFRHACHSYFPRDTAGIFPLPIADIPNADKVCVMTSGQWVDLGASLGFGALFAISLLAGRAGIGLHRDDRPVTYWLACISYATAAVAFLAAFLIDWI